MLEQQTGPAVIEPDAKKISDHDLRADTDNGTANLQSIRSWLAFGPTEFLRRLRAAETHGTFS